MSIDQSVLDKFEAVVESQRKRIMDMKAQDDFIDYSKLDKLIIGVCGGDGIGPMITGMAQHALEVLLADKVKAGKVEFRVIDGLTIERRAELGCAIPPDVMEELKKCHVILKGPTTTPRKGDPWPNVESANVAMRKALDLFANVRPVKVPELGIDWTFYRENTEGGYAVGSQGVQIDDDLFIDFTVATSQGCERIARLAFDYARKTGKNRVSCVTKANIIKTTDGKFLDTSSPTRPLRSRAVSVRQALPISASATRCSRQFTALRRVWYRKAAQSTRIRPPYCVQPLCCLSTSVKSNWQRSSTAHLISAW